MRPSVLFMPPIPTRHPRRPDKEDEDEDDTASNTVDDSQSLRGSEEELSVTHESASASSGLYVAPPAVPQRRMPTRLAVALSDQDEDSGSDGATTASERGERDMSIKLDMSPEPTGTREEEEKEVDEATAPLPVTHGEYFEGSLLASPVRRKAPHSRLSFLHVHLNESDEEGSHSDSGDSASSDEVVDRRQPYYQVYKIEKRERRLNREENMAIRKPEATSSFSIPHAHMYDPRGRPKSFENFQAPAASPPRNASGARVE